MGDLPTWLQGIAVAIATILTAAASYVAARSAVKRQRAAEDFKLSERVDARVDSFMTRQDKRIDELEQKEEELEEQVKQLREQVAVYRMLVSKSIRVTSQAVKELMKHNPELATKLEGELVSIKDQMNGHLT